MQLLIFAAKTFDFAFQFRKPLRPSGMLAFPIPDLLSQFQVLAPQTRHLLAQLCHFQAQSLHHLHPLSREHLPGTFGNHAFHDKVVL
ncbi:MAG: hypothetical protein ACRD2Y_13690 [Terriglobales bacterium]